MTDDKKKHPPGLSRFKELLDKLVKVPKNELDERENQYRRERQRLKKRGA